MLLDMTDLCDTGVMLLNYQLLHLKSTDTQLIVSFRAESWPESNDRIGDDRVALWVM